jgi:FxsC-like protein
LRKAVESYGTGGRMEWQPYLPTAKKSIGVLAQEVVSKQNLFYYPWELETTDNLVEKLLEAEINKEIVLIIVDAWTIRIAEYRDFIKPYDKINLTNCSVLVPWNEQDPETDQHRAELEAAIKDTFQFTAQLKRNTVYYRGSITSDKALKTNLMKTLSDIRMKLLETADDPTEPIQDAQLVDDAREKGITLETLSTVQSPSGGPT